MTTEGVVPGMKKPPRFWVTASRSGGLRWTEHRNTSGQTYLALDMSENEARNLYKLLDAKLRLWDKLKEEYGEQ